MSTSDCPKCGRWLFGPDRTTHRCPPEWEARIPDFHCDDWVTVRGATDDEAAAESLAEQCDGEGSLLGNGEGWLVEVRKPGDEASLRRFRVTAEVSVNYSASEEP